MDHGRIECSCGALIAQCRCFGSHEHKVVIQEHSCGACQFASAIALHKVPEILPAMSPHQPGHDCPECHWLDAPAGENFTLRDLIFQAVYAELSGDSILHYLIQRHEQPITRVLEIAPMQKIDTETGGGTPLEPTTYS